MSTESDRLDDEALRLLQRGRTRRRQGADTAAMLDLAEAGAVSARATALRLHELIEHLREAPAPRPSEPVPADAFLATLREREARR